MTVATGNTAVTEAAGAAPAAKSCKELLKQMRPEVESLLERMPENKLEARRFITRELGMSPRAEELQMMVRITDDPATEGPRFEVPRHLLALRILADRRQREFFDSSLLDPELIGRGATIFSELIDASRALEDELGVLLEDRNMTSMSDRDYLLQVAEPLSVPREPLIAATVLAPRLQHITRAALAGNLADLAPDLTGKEVACFVTATRESHAENPIGRVGLDALAMRLLMEDHIAQWERLPGLEGERLEEVREQLVERLKSDKIAYHFIMDRLQQQQDNALVADLGDFAQELRSIGKQLFSVYLRFVPRLREAISSDSGGVDEQRVEQLQEESAKAKARAKAKRPGRSNDEVFVDALNASRKKQPQPEKLLSPDQQDRAREKKRLTWLGAVAAVLVVVTVFFQVSRHRAAQASAPIRSNLTDYSEALELSSVRTIGVTLYARATAWKEIPAAKRDSVIHRLGRLASGKGYGAVFLVDSNGEAVARWSSTHGVKLMEPVGPPAGDRARSDFRR